MPSKLFRKKYRVPSSRKFYCAGKLFIQRLYRLLLDLALSCSYTAVALALSADRSVTSMELSSRWRDLTGDVPEAVQLDYESCFRSVGDPINIQFTGNDVDELRQIAGEVKEVLGPIPEYTVSPIPFASPSGK